MDGARLARTPLPAITARNEALDAEQADIRRDSAAQLARLKQKLDEEVRAGELALAHKLALLDENLALFRAALDVERASSLHEQHDVMRERKLEAQRQQRESARVRALAAQRLAARTREAQHRAGCEARYTAAANQVRLAQRERLDGARARHADARMHAAAAVRRRAQSSQHVRSPALAQVARRQESHLRRLTAQRQARQRKSAELFRATTALCACEEDAASGHATGSPSALLVEVPRVALDRIVPQRPQTKRKWEEQRDMVYPHARGWGVALTGALQVFPQPIP